jgi:hypothetical protein
MSDIFDKALVQKPTENLSNCVGELAGIHCAVQHVLQMFSMVSSDLTGILARLNDVLRVS